MTWLQLSLTLPADALRDTEQLFEARGALALTLLDDADEPLLEPAPGETPIWSRVRLRALFPLQVDLENLGHELRSSLQVTRLDLDVEFVPDQDWQASSAAHAVNEVFGGRLWLQPKHASTTPPDVPGLAFDQQGTGAARLVRVYLEPGLAFGSGSHPTTRMCLDWLARHVDGPVRVLDFGCGSGVLGIAAALLGARVVAVDHDAQAVMASRDNAAYNGLTAAQLEVTNLAGWRRARGSEFDVVIANILATPLMELAPELVSALRPGGSLVLSGLLEDQGESVMSRYPDIRFTAPLREAGWLCLQGTKTV